MTCTTASRDRRSSSSSGPKATPSDDWRPLPLRVPRSNRRVRRRAVAAVLVQVPVRLVRRQRLQESPAVGIDVFRHRRRIPAVRDSQWNRLRARRGTRPTGRHQASGTESNRAVGAVAHRLWRLGCRPSRNVRKVTHATLFGGYYQNLNQPVSSAGVDLVEFLDVIPEMKVPPGQLDRVLASRTGAFVGSSTADRYGWRLGDRIPIKSAFWINRSGQRELDLRSPRNSQQRPRR